MTEDEVREALIYGAEDPNVDPSPGVTETPIQAVRRLGAQLHRAKRKAAAANRALEYQVQHTGRLHRRHRQDVAEAFTRALAAELEGIPLPVASMPDISGLIVDNLRGAMYYSPDSPAIQEWIDQRHPSRK